MRSDGGGTARAGRVGGMHKHGKAFLAKRRKGWVGLMRIGTRARTEKTGGRVKQIEQAVPEGTACPANVLPHGLLRRREAAPGRRRRGPAGPAATPAAAPAIPA